MKDADKIKAATLLVHGGNDFNVMTKNAAQLWDVLKKNNVARQFYFHQGGHSNPLPNEMANRWFTKYLWGQDNGVQNQPKSWVVRETDACPPRELDARRRRDHLDDDHRGRRQRLPGRQLAYDPADERQREIRRRATITTSPATR